MPYDVSIDEKPGYLRLEVSGERVRGQEVMDALELWKQIKEICIEKQVSHLLAVYHIKGKLPILSAYDLGTESVRMDFIRKVKVAFVDLNPESQAANRFVELVAQNRTSFGDNGRMFFDETEAVKWLLGEQEQLPQKSK